MGWVSSVYDDYFANMECLEEQGKKQYLAARDASRFDSYTWVPTFIDVLGIDGTTRKIYWIGWNKNSLWAKFITMIHEEKSALDVFNLLVRSVEEKKRSLSLSFRRSPRGGAEEEQFKALQSCVTDLLLPQMYDRWV
nr:hypothetical protein [Tanacetum cinerariifolium]